MKHEFIDHHREGNSFVHQADPRLKFIILFVYIFIVVLIPYRERHLFLYLGLIPLLMALGSGISLFHFFGKLSRLYPMVFLISFLLPFFPANSDRVFHLWVLNIYEHGLQKFFMINVKSVLAMFMSVIITSTTDFNMLLKGMEKLRLPRMMIVILSFMYRFIFLLIDETERMWMAYQSRYIHLPLMHRIKFLARQIGVLFIRTYERGERVYQAMDARGFQGKVYTMNDLSWQKKDTALFLLFATSILLIIFRMF